MIFGLFFSNLRGWFDCDVIMTSSPATKSVSFITWFLWCLFRVTFWIKQAFTKQWSEHSVFRIRWHTSVTWSKLSHGFVTWHHGVTWYSDLFYSEMFKSDEIHLYFSLYMWGVTNMNVTFLRCKVLHSNLVPPLLLCEWVSFKSNMTHSWQ